MTSLPGLSEACKASPSDESLQFFQKHGFFVEEDLEIGETVDQLYKEQLFKDPDGLDRFRQRLMDLPRIRKILERYELTALMTYPWGTTPAGAFYAATHRPFVHFINLYVIAAGTRIVCRDGSQALHSKGIQAEIGMVRIADPYLAEFPESAFEMKQGGVIAMHPRLAHSSNGRSIIYSLREIRTEKHS